MPGWAQRALIIAGAGLAGALIGAAALATWFLWGNVILIR